MESKPTERAIVFWCSFSFFLLILVIHILRVLKDEMAIVAGLNNLKTLISVTFLLILMASFVLVRLKKPLLVYLALIVLTILTIASYDQDASHFQAALIFIMVGVLSLLLMSHFWMVLQNMFEFGKASKYYGMIISVGGTGAVIGPGLLIFLVNTGWVYLLKPVLFVLLLLSVLALFLARSYSFKFPEKKDSRPVTREGNTKLVLGGFVFLYSIIATFLYYQQLDIVDTHLVTSGARKIFFGMRDMLIGILTLAIQWFVFKKLSTKTLWRNTGGIPAFTLLLVILLGIFPTIASVFMVVVLFRTGNYIITKPVRELYYKADPALSNYRGFIDTAVYRGGDLIGIWGFFLLKELGLNHFELAICVIPLIVIWYLLSHKISTTLKNLSYEKKDNT